MLGREVGRGAIQVFLAEALAVPAGLLLAGMLSRALGPEDYGRYGLAVAIVLGGEFLIAAGYNRISLILLSDPGTREAAVATVLRHYLCTSLMLFGTLVIGAGLAGDGLSAPRLAADLRLLAIDLPLFALGQVKRVTVTASGAYGGRALAIAGRWITRVVATWLLLEMGWGLTGALSAWIVASGAEIALLGGVSLDPLFDRRRVEGVWREAWAPFVFAVGQRVLDRADLILLQYFGAPAAGLGIYVAAQNLSILPGIFAAALAPVLIAALTRVRIAGQEPASRRTAALALRFTLCMLPMAFIFGICGEDLAAFAFGAHYRESGLYMGWLTLGGIGIALSGIAVSILGAQGRHRRSAWFSIPAATVAAALHLAVIPRYGMGGAARVTAAVALISGLAGAAAIYRGWREPLPVATMLRIAAACAAVALLGRWESLAAAPLAVRLLAMAAAAGGTLVFLGEWEPRRWRMLLARTAGE